MLARYTEIYSMLACPTTCPVLSYYLHITEIASQCVCFFPWALPLTTVLSQCVFQQKAGHHFVIRHKSNHLTVEFAL